MDVTSSSGEFSPELLREWRKKAGLRISELASVAKVNEGNLCRYEAGKKRPSLQTWEKLQRVLRIGRKKLQELQADTWITPPKKELPTPKTFSFIIGNTYTIKDIRDGGQAYCEMYPHSGAMCLFRYAGKDGIHHVFIETQGGWQRTYTDAQLIGKQIKEHT